MDDDLEDEVFYQTIMSHGKILSKFIVSIPFHACINTMSRYFRFYFSKPECIIVLIVTFAVFAFFINLDTSFKSAVLRLQEAGSGYVFSPRTKSSPSTGKDVTDGRPAGLFSARVFSSLSDIGEDVTWKMKDENVAAYSVKGRRSHMEDRYQVYRHKLFTLYGIFDGHGGEFAADFVKKNLLERIGKRLENLFDTGDEHSVSYSTIIKEEMLAVDQQLVGELKAKKDVAGTTAVVALVIDNELIVANVGDSRGVMCDGSGLTQPLTFDHKPQQPKERSRIQSAGGFVSFNGVWRVAGVLATSRAFGDFPLKEKNLVIAEPDILTFKLNVAKPQFLILATDGLWDMLKNEEAVEHVKSILSTDSHYGASSLVKLSYERGSLDNISVMIVKF